MKVNCTSHLGMSILPPGATPAITLAGLARLRFCLVVIFSTGSSILSAFLAVGCTSAGFPVGCYQKMSLKLPAGGRGGEVANLATNSLPVKSLFPSDLQPRRISSSGSTPFSS